MKLLLATDAGQPQVNGVVTTLTNTVGRLRAWGHEVRLVSPQHCPTSPNVSYLEIALAITTLAPLREELASFQPDHIHIATEGPIGRP